ncbi:GntR family transcriptional regulator [Rhodococcus sp. WS4]|nr:GntR family transcriptional regulator [Rhodococcus sp. WS4]
MTSTTDPTAVSIADRAYSELHSDILDGRLPPGTPLSVPALAGRLGISRSPVREAVQRLIHEGLATHVLNRGAEVVRVDPAELLDIYRVKAPLEGLAARLATTRMTGTDVDALRAQLDEQDATLASGAGASEFIRLDMEFHRRIRIAAGSDTLTRTLAQFDSRTHLAVPNLWSDDAAAALSVAEHHDIFRGLSAGDPDGAQRAAVTHATCVRVRLSRLHGVPLDGL